jgi:hypothetical protein
MSYRCHKTVEVDVFPTIFAHDIRIRIRISDLWIRIRIREAQKHIGPTDPDPDPQHWCLPSWTLT